jgi:hypothetical protein
VIHNIYTKFVCLCDPFKTKCKSPSRTKSVRINSKVGKALVTRSTKKRTKCRKLDLLLNKFDQLSWTLRLERIFGRNPGPNDRHSPVKLISSSGGRSSRCELCFRRREDSTHFVRMQFASWYFPIEVIISRTITTQGAPRIRLEVAPSFSADFNV